MRKVILFEDDIVIFVIEVFFTSAIFKMKLIESVWIKKLKSVFFERRFQKLASFCRRRCFFENLKRTNARSSSQISQTKRFFLINDKTAISCSLKRICCNNLSLYFPSPLAEYIEVTRAIRIDYLIQNHRICALHVITFRLVDKVSRLNSRTLTSVRYKLRATQMHRKTYRSKFKSYAPLAAYLLVIALLFRYRRYICT